MVSMHKLGEYIEKLNRSNTELLYGIDDVAGITNTKEITVGTKANLIGRTFEKFTILKPGEFIFNRRTSRNGERISLGYNQSDGDWILTEDYCHFRIRDNKLEELDPDYLYLYFLRPEFDRYARFNSWGSATEFFNWEEMVEVPVPVPPIQEQRKIVHDYKVVTNRIELLKKINENLEAQAYAFLKNQIDEDPCNTTAEHIFSLFDSMRKPVSGADRANVAKIYPYYGAAALMDYIDEYIFDGIYGLLGEDGTVIDENGYPTMQYVWGKFWVNNHAHVFQGANGFSTEMAYLILKHTVVKDIVTGAVQLKINQENLRNLPVAVPNDNKIEMINNCISRYFDLIRANADEKNQLEKLQNMLLSNLA